jgi:hypothetical protein
MLDMDMLLARAGNFTGSQNHRLMAGWSKPKPKLNIFEGALVVYAAIKELQANGEKILVGTINAHTGLKFNGAQIKSVQDIIKAEKVPQGLITYAQEKALEELFNVDPSLNFSTVHTRNGEEREIECMEILSEKTGIDFINTGENQAHIHVNGVGCTPDGIAIDDIDMIHTGAEVKCKSPLEHAHSLFINNTNDLKEQAFDHFVQCQTGMLVTGSDHWYFANYNPYAKSELLQFKYIVVQRDDAFIAIMQERINLAKEIKAEFLAKVLENVAKPAPSQAEAA